MARRSGFAGIERVLAGPRLRLFVEPFHVGLELLAIDPPYPAAPDLDRGKVPRADECVHLRHAHTEVGRDVLEGEEPGLDARTGLVLLRHRATLSPVGNGILDLMLFAFV